MSEALEKQEIKKDDTLTYQDKEKPTDNKAENASCDTENKPISCPEKKDEATQNEEKKDSPVLLVEAKGLSKKYGSFEALKSIDLELPYGKIIGLLGPNGSGKTTFIKILANILTKTKGEVKIDGLEVGTNTKAIVSYLPERPYFNSWMTVEQCLKFFEEFYKDFDREVAEKMLLDLDIDKSRKLRTLSKGTKEKVQLILVMSRRAKLYLLDEPIAGVDPAARDYILNTIISTYNKEASVIISTHLISDIEEVLDEYVFIRYGDIIEHSSIEKFKKEHDISLDNHFREVFKYVR